jgi:hypothetical protein
MKNLRWLIMLLWCIPAHGQVDSPKPKVQQCEISPWNGRVLAYDSCPDLYKKWYEVQSFHSAVKDRWFWTGEAFMGAAIAADAATTSRAIGHGYIEQHTLICGPYPSNKCLTAAGIGEFAFDTALLYFSYRLGQHDPNKFWRVLSRTLVPAGITIAHGGAAIHNNAIYK